MMVGFKDKFKKLGDKPGSNSPVADILGQQSKAVIRVHHSELYSNPQVRKTFHEESIRELGRSMRNEEQHHPIVVSPRDKKGYCIQKGERRWRAAQFENLDVDIIVRQPSSDECKEIIGQLGENIHNELLSAIEVAESLHRLKEEFGLNTEQLKEAVSKSDAYISQHLNLLKLPEPVMELAQNGTVKDADTLNELRKAHKLDEGKTVAFLEKVATDGVSRSEAKAFYKALKNPEPMGYRPPSREQVIIFHREAKNQNDNDFVVSPEYLFNALFPGQPWDSYEHVEAFTDDIEQFVAELDQAFKPEKKEKKGRATQTTNKPQNKAELATKDDAPREPSQNSGSDEFVQCSAEKIVINVRVDGDVGSLIMTRVDPTGENVWVNMPYGELSVPVNECELLGVSNE